MDTRMLDVAIGLVLVFAITSLLVTAWQEALASMKNSRGENLRKAIASLLGDDAAFAERLLDHPLLLSLAMERPGQTQRMPSYIPADVLVNALLAQLSTDYTGGLRPATPGDLVAHLRQKLPPAQQKFADSLAALASGVEQDWSAYESRLIAWFNAVSERSIGWFKRSTQLQMFVAGAVVAALMNINPILITQALWSDAALRKTMVAQAELAVQAYKQESGLDAQAQPASAPDASASPLPLAPLRQATQALIQSLEKEPDAQGLPGASTGTDLLRSGYEMKALLNPERPASLGELQQKLRSLQEQLQDSTLSQHPATVAQLRAMQDSLQALAPSQAASSPAAKACPATLSAEERKLCASRHMLKELEGLGLPLGWGQKDRGLSWPQANLPTLLPTQCNGGSGASQAQKPPHCSLSQQMSEFFWWINALLALLGWLLTAMAVTLGAPFWFDLLGKLVKIRGAGGHPDEAAKGGTATPTASTLTKAAPAAATQPGEPAQEASQDAMNEAEKRLGPNEIGSIQQHLRMAASDISLRLDIKTRDAIKAWQEQAFGQGSGILSEQQIQQVLSADFDPLDDGFLG